MLRSFILLYILKTVRSEGIEFVVNPGPTYRPTNGEVWPKPQHEVKENIFFTYDHAKFKIITVDKTCELLTIAIERYRAMIINYIRHVKMARQKGMKKKDSLLIDDYYQGLVWELHVVLTSPCEEYPHFGMTESYELTVESKSTLTSSSIWGIMRGLETFSQLFYIHNDVEIRINATRISDYPRYAHRGLLLDTGRHYVSITNILKTLDAMAMNKMNVFHWHIVDDQSFPYESKVFPELSKKGAFHSSMVYTKSDIKMIIKYARNRGIRVIPEFDVPGHTRSWGVAYPDILTKCYNNDNYIGLGPMNPISNVTIKLLNALFREVQTEFPDDYFHIGGDEVVQTCWENNHQIIKYLADHHMAVKDLHALFMKKVIGLLSNRTTPIVWQDVYDSNVPLPRDALVQVWRYGWINEMIKILEAGHLVLFSASWYLDYLDHHVSDLYQADPRQMVYEVTYNKDLLENIVGGEACMWGEKVDDRNVISRVWPRASAVAEVLWSTVDQSMTIPDDVYQRLEEHTCRMVRHGIQAEPPYGPSFCVVL